MTNMEKYRIDLLVILGPTATGKTRLAVRLADRFNGEIISADSRQVYRGMDVGTGKDIDEYRLPHRTIPCHLIDIIEPDLDYSVFRFQRDFYTAYEHIRNLQRLPVLCGGTGLYIESILLNFKMVQVPPDYKLRARLEKFSLTELQEKLKTLKPDHHNTSDFLHRKRLVRAIEIALNPVKKTEPPVKIFHPLVLGISYPRETVRKRITERLRFRLNNGLIEEVETLLSKGITHHRLEYFGLEYKFISRYLQGELNRNDLFQKLNTAIHQYSKRQMTFFRHMEKRGIKIHWLDEGNPEAAEILVANHLNYREPDDGS